VCVCSNLCHVLLVTSCPLLLPHLCAASPSTAVACCQNYLEHLGAITGIPLEAVTLQNTYIVLGSYLYELPAYMGLTLKLKPPAKLATTPLVNLPPNRSHPNSPTWLHHACTGRPDAHHCNHPPPASDQHTAGTCCGYICHAVLC
jgi:hypothetical protein